MKELSEIRKEINSIDDDLVKLFVRRLEIVQDVARSKKETNQPIMDPAREREILSKVAEKVGPDLENSGRLFFSTLFNVSRARQREIIYETNPLMEQIKNSIETTPAKFPTRAVVACQGTEGAYSQQAASLLFSFPTILYFNTFDDVFSAVEKGMCDYGILPIENSAAGSVSAVYDMMVKHNFHIARAIRERISHVLLAPKGVKVEDVKEISSHPHAIAQCNEFFRAHPKIRQTPDANTAIAARNLALSGRKDMAVIASRACADLYGLEIIAEDISNVATNYTRFICISKNLQIYPDSHKFSVMMSLPHKPGTLYNVMAKFASINVNLTKLESRPIPGMDFEFRFSFDFEASPSDPQVLKLLAELESDPDIEHFSFLGAFAEK